MKGAYFVLFKNDSVSQPFGTELRGANRKLIGGINLYSTKQNAWKGILATCAALRTPGMNVSDISMPDGVTVHWTVVYDEATSECIKTEGVEA